MKFAGNKPGSGKYFCIMCEEEIIIRKNETLPICPSCNYNKYE
ncbi:hypothetical protein KY321_05055 [Candidatus Woesearchaeota archaeon]|nr:hypothetical protein [Candidatus Woesearchaeota archaeon]